MQHTRKAHSDTQPHSFQQHYAPYFSLWGVTPRQSSHRTAFVQAGIEKVIRSASHSII